MSTPRDLIRFAMGALTLLPAGEAVDPLDEADAFAILNMMLGTWGNKRTRIFSSVEETFVLTPGQASYTIGTGGEFDTVRPVKIEGAYLRDNVGQDYPIKIIEDRSEYSRLITKDISARPFSLYFERLFSSSLGNVILNREPEDAETLYLILWKSFVKFVTLTETIVMPEGYEEAIYSQLAIRIASHFGKEIPASLAVVARDAVLAIDTVNLEVPILEPDSTPGVSEEIYVSDIRSDT